MRAGKEIVAAAAAMAMAVTGGVTSLAADDSKYNSATLEVLSGKVVTDSGGMSSELTGTVSIMDTKVKVSVKAIFDIDLNKIPTIGIVFLQMADQAINYTITSLSSVPLSISITNATIVRGSKTARVASGFVITLNDLEPEERGIMFSIRPLAIDIASAPVLPADKTAVLADSWLRPSPATGRTTGDIYKFQDNGDTYKLEATDTARGKDVLTMTLYEAVKRGWASGNTFTVTPTFTVNLVGVVIP